MAKAIIAHPQSRANLLRALLASDPAISRAGSRLERVEGLDEGLVVLASHGGRSLRLERGPEWRATPLVRLKQSLKGQLLGRAGPVEWLRPDRRARGGERLRLTPFPPAGAGRTGGGRPRQRSPRWR